MSEGGFLQLELSYLLNGKMTGMSADHWFSHTLKIIIKKNTVFALQAFNLLAPELFF
jgi:hypothetical protein